MRDDASSNVHTSGDCVGGLGARRAGKSCRRCVRKGAGSAGAVAFGAESGWLMTTWAVWCPTPNWEEGQPREYPCHVAGGRLEVIARALWVFDELNCGEGVPSRIFPVGQWTHVVRMHPPVPAPKVEDR